MEPTRLTPIESLIARWVEDDTPVPKPSDGKPYPIRARVLRRLILQLPVQLDRPHGDEKDEPRNIAIAETGIRLSHLEVTGDTKPPSEADKSGILNLQNACGEKGIALPPLHLEDCFFPETIRMSRARFRSLSLKGSRLMYLRANGLRVEGALNLSHIRSSLDTASSSISDEIAKDKSMPHRAAEPWGKIGGPIKRLLPHQPISEEDLNQISFDGPTNPRWPISPDVVEAWRERDVVVDGRKLEAVDLGAANPRSMGLCYIELRNARIGIDLDVSSSILVSPYQDKSLINSPHAHHALDLRGSHIGGRFTFSPSYLEKCPPFIAIGGISIVRATIDGSVCGSGAQLIAVEGSAFAAQRATIRSHLFLDYSWEGQGRWTRFRAHGFIDLTNTRIGASLYMHGTKLRADSITRAGLIASRAEIGGACYLCAAEIKGKTPPYPYERFFSEGGVSLDKATIHGDLDMNGAFLRPNSFGKALYVPALTLDGTARLSTFPLIEQDGDTPQRRSQQSRRFTTIGPLVLEHARFRKDVNMWGCRLYSHPSTRKKRILNADLSDIRGWFRLDSIVMSDGCIYRTVVKGSISMKNATIGMSLSMNGAEIYSSQGDYIALNLSSADFKSNLELSFATYKETPHHSPFQLYGTLCLQGATIGNRLDLKGATISLYDLKKRAIEALNLHVTSRVELGPTSMEYPRGDKANGTPPPTYTYFKADGCLDFTHATLPVGLWMDYATVCGSFISTQGRQFALITNAATIARIEMSHCTFTGHVRLTNLNAFHGVVANNLTINNGILDLWEASLGELELCNWSIQGAVISPEDLADYIRIVCDRHHSTSQPKSTKPIFRSKKDWEWEDVLHLGRARIDGKLTIKKDVKQQPDKKHLNTETIPPRYANLRGLEVGELSDDIGQGWGTLKLKLNGFVRHRSPERPSNENEATLRRRFRLPTRFISALTVLGVALFFAVLLKSHKWVPCALIGTMIIIMVRALGFLRNEFHKADAYVEWLNRQFKNPQIPEPSEFIPESYEQLARTLRSEGYDQDANRILSAKFDIERKTSQAFAKFLWRIYGFCFDYGLSSAPAILTLAILLSTGALAALLAAHQRALVVIPLVQVGSTPQANSTQLPACSTGDSIVYSMEVFIPELKFSDPRQCDLANDASGERWRPLRALYVCFGWIVSSITLLTIPGILRRRAEG